jgi:hypothetical protein
MALLHLPLHSLQAVIPVSLDRRTSLLSGNQKQVPDLNPARQVVCLKEARRLLMVVQHLIMRKMASVDVLLEEIRLLPEVRQPTLAERAARRNKLACLQIAVV